MGLQKLKYPSLRVCDELRKAVASNLDRYLEGDFEDLASSDDWAIPLSVEFDPTPLESLVANKGDDATCSMLVWQALGSLPPSLASEGRIWTRLSHMTCLEYARARWIGERTGPAAVKVIEDHFFAATRTACRDDNAVGRLWWTSYIAKRAMPNDHARAVQAIWKSADIRSNIVERPWISSRPRLAGAIVRAIISKPAVTASEATFRAFMKALNIRGGGLLFEAMSDGDVDVFVADCLPKGAA